MPGKTILYSSSASEVESGQHPLPTRERGVSAVNHLQLLVVGADKEFEARGCCSLYANFKYIIHKFRPFFDFTY